MRILYIQPAEGFGGAERQGVLYISKLPREGIDVVPVVGPGEPVRRALQAAGVDDYLFRPDLFVPAAAGPSGPLTKLRRAGEHIAAWRRATTALTTLGRERGVDLVFASRPYGWTVGSFVARRLGVPVVWRVGSRPPDWIHRMGTRLLRPIVPELAVANSDAARGIFRSLLGTDVLLLRNGVDTERFDPRRASPRIRRALGLDDDVPVVGLAARPAPEKGLDRLAAIIRHVAERVPRVRLLVAGEYGWRSHYQQLFAQLGLADRVTFLGHVDDIESFYASCNVIVLTSPARSIESSSNAVLEAMAMERPVVVSPYGGLKEAVTHGVDGLVADPENAAGFGGCVVELLRAPSFARRLGKAARATIQVSFSAQLSVARLATLLRQTHAMYAAPRLAPAARASRPRALPAPPRG